MRNKSVSLWRIGPFLSIKNQAKWRKVLLVLLLEKEPISNRSPTPREGEVRRSRTYSLRALFDWWLKLSIDWKPTKCIVKIRTRQQH